MPNWKKLLVSGSDASLNSLNVTTNVTAQSFTGSFSGSVAAPGSTTQVVYNNGGVLAANSGLVYSGGSVGIGTSSPSRTLHVSSSNSVLLLQSSTSYAGTQNKTPQGNFYVALDSNTSPAFGTSNSAVLWSDTNAPMIFATNNSEKVRITSAGNVGIGTTSPTQKLDVAGAISVSGSVVDYEVAPALIGGITTTNIISFTPGTTYAAFVDYVIKDSAGATNQRVGTIQISISQAAAAAVLNEVTTVDIGNTTAITFTVSYGAPTWLTATNSGPTPYDINYMVRYF